MWGLALLRPIAPGSTVDFSYLSDIYIIQMRLCILSWKAAQEVKLWLSWGVRSGEGAQRLYLLLLVILNECNCWVFSPPFTTNRKSVEGSRHFSANTALEEIPLGLTELRTLSRLDLLL